MSDSRPLVPFLVPGVPSAAISARFARPWFPDGDDVPPRVPLRFRFQALAKLVMRPRVHGPDGVVVDNPRLLFGHPRGLELGDQNDVISLEKEVRRLVVGVVSPALKLVSQLRRFSSQAQQLVSSFGTSQVRVQTPCPHSVDHRLQTVHSLRHLFDLVVEVAFEKLTVGPIG